MLYQLVLAFHTIVAILIIVLVFMQHGKGADIGAAFGSGASNTVFGSKGSAGPLYKMTAALAIMFCATSISLTAILAKERGTALDVSDTAPASTSVESPATKSSSKDSKSSDVPVVPK